MASGRNCLPPAGRVEFGNARHLTVSTWACVCALVATRRVLRENNRDVEKRMLGDGTLGRSDRVVIETN